MLSSDFSHERSVLSQLASDSASEATTVSDLFVDRDVSFFANAIPTPKPSGDSKKHGAMSAAEKQQRLAAVRKRLGLTITRKQGVLTRSPSKDLLEFVCCLTRCARDFEVVLLRVCCKPLSGVFVAGVTASLLDEAREMLGAIPVLER
mgnify:CR=1 FL=1